MLDRNDLKAIGEIVNAAVTKSEKRMIKRIDAVSYTHLDVYKRQVKRQGGFNFKRACRGEKDDWYYFPRDGAQGTDGPKAGGGEDEQGQQGALGTGWVIPFLF